MNEYSFLGSGSFGCVIKPGYVCHNYQQEKFKNLKTISKLFVSKEEWEKENRIQKMIEAEIDKTSKFTVKMLDSCPKPGSIAKEIKDIYKCKQVINEDNRIYQIIYEYGGVDLHRILSNVSQTATSRKINVLKIFVSLFDVLQGIEKMVLVDYIHHDIKIDNILYNEDTNKAKLIDFGFCVRRKDCYDNLSFFFEDESNLQHQFFPVEFNLIFHAYLNKNGLTKDEAKNLNFYKACLDLVPFISRINANPMIPKAVKAKVDEVKKKLAEYLENCSKILLLFKDANKDLLKPTKNDIDIYISAISLAHSRNKVDIRYKIDVYMFGLSLLYFLLMGMIYLKEETGIYKVPLELFDLILKMIDSNPFTRYSIQEAVADYKKIFSL